MIRKKGVKKSPSRVRYERNNPVISFRATKEMLERTEAVKKAEGKSNADIFEDGLGLNEVKIRSEKDIRDEAYQKGYTEGYQAARKLYAVTFLCIICRKTIEVTTEEVKNIIRKRLRELRWGHAECHKKHPLLDFPIL